MLHCNSATDPVLATVGRPPQQTAEDDDDPQGRVLTAIKRLAAIEGELQHICALRQMDEQAQARLDDGLGELQVTLYTRLRALTKDGYE